MNGEADVTEGMVLGGRYRLIRLAGEGGMAVVWEARDDVLARTVAVKVLAPEWAGDPESRERIRREAQAAAAIAHPNIAQVHDYGEAHEVPYVVMEFVPGGTLLKRLGQGPQPPRFAMRVGAEVAAALAAAHTEGLVHRDVKPANVMLSTTGAKVVDFGIAAAITPAGVGTDGEMVYGTPAFLAPERLLSDAVEPASDVYALGVLLHLILTGRSPWTIEDTTEMLSAHIYLDPPPLPPIPGVPGYVIELVNRCLLKEPAMRPSAREAAALLARGAGMRVVTDEPDIHPASDETSLLLRVEPPKPRPAPVPPHPAAANAAQARFARTHPAGARPERPHSPDIPPERGRPTAAPADPAPPTATPPDVARPAAAPDAALSAAPLERAHAPAAPAGPAHDLPTRPQPAESGPPERRRRRLLLVAAAVLLLVAAVATAWALRPDDPSAAPAAGPSSAAWSAPPAGLVPTTTASRTTAAAPGGTGAVPPRALGTTTTHPGAGPAVSPAATTAAATAGPAPEQPTTAATTAAAPQERTFTSDAGWVRATCPSTATARIVSWAATKPYKVAATDEGPGSAPSVRFKHGNTTVTMTVACTAGTPAATVT